MADLPASSGLRADAPSWQPKAAVSVTTPPQQTPTAVESAAVELPAAAGANVVHLKPAAKRMASPDVATGKAADQEAAKRSPATAVASSKPASNGTTSRPSPSSPTAARATSTASSSSQGATRPALPKGVAKVVLMPRPRPVAGSSSSTVTTGPPPGLSGVPSSSGAPAPVAAAAHASSSSRGGSGLPASSSSKPSSGPAAAAGSASANGRGQHSVQDLVVAIDRAWPEGPDPTAAAEAQVKQVLAHYIVTNPTPNQPPYSILASSANQFLNQQLGQGWREALQLPKISDLLKGDPHFTLGPPIKSNRLITVNAELLLRSAGISTGGSGAGSSSIAAAAGAPKTSSRSTDAHVQLPLGKRAAGAAAGTAPAASSSSSAGAAGKSGLAAAPMPASFSKPPGLGLKQAPQLLGRPGGAAGASSPSCSAASAAVAVAMAVAAADPATAGYTAAIARHWAGDASGIAQVQQLVALHLVTCSDCASDTVSVNACLEAELGHNWVKRLQFPPLLDMLHADCFILGPRTTGYKRTIQLDLAALGLGKVAPSRAAAAAAAPAEVGSQRPAKPSAAAAGSSVALVPRAIPTAAKTGNTTASSTTTSSSHPAGLSVPAAAAGVGTGGRALESPSPKGSKQASPELLEVAVQAVADMTSSAAASGVPKDLLSALARRWAGKRTVASLLQHMVALQLVTSSDYTGDTTRAYQMVQGWLGAGWREKLAAPRLVEVLLADQVFLVGPPALKMRPLTLNVDLLQGKGRSNASAATSGAAAAGTRTASPAAAAAAAAAAGKPPSAAAAAAGGSRTLSAGEARAQAQPPPAVAMSAHSRLVTVEPSVLLEQPLAVHPGVALPPVGEGLGAGGPLQVDAGALSFIALLPSRLHDALLPYAALRPGEVLRGLVLDPEQPPLALLADGGQQQLPPACTPTLQESLQALAAGEAAPQQAQQRLVRKFLRWRRAAAAAAAAAAAGAGGSAAGATAGSHRQHASSAAADSTSLPDAPSEGAGAAAAAAVPSSTTAAGDGAPPLTTQLLQQHDQEQVAAEQVLAAGRRRSAASSSSSSSSSSDTGSDKGSEGLLEYLQCLGVDVAEGGGTHASGAAAAAESGSQGAPAAAADAEGAPQGAIAAGAEEAAPGAAEPQVCPEATSTGGQAAGAAPGVQPDGAEEAAAAAVDGLAKASCVSVDGDSSPCGGTMSSSSSCDDEGVELCVDVQLQQAMEQALSQGAPLQVAGTLHRVCGLRGVTGKVTGLTYHVGRHLPQLAPVAGQVLSRVAAGVHSKQQASLLLVGRPGSGKTTLLQSLAAALAAPCEAGGHGLQVVVVLPAASLACAASRKDTSGSGSAGAAPGTGLELGGTAQGDVATAATSSCWGNCRVVVTPAGGDKGAAVLAAAQQHMAQVVVVDDISFAQESQAAAALVTSGVTLVAAARAATVAHLESAPNLAALASMLHGPCQGRITTLEAQSVNRWSIRNLELVDEPLPAVRRQGAAAASPA